MLFRQLQRVREAVRLINDQNAVRGDGGKPLLPGEGLQQIVNQHHEADGGCLFSEVAQQPVIAAALCHRVAHAVGIGLENDACIIIVLA